MSALPVLRMPFLHKELYPSGFPSAPLRLWPGSPNPPDDAYIPEDLPLSPEEAARRLEEERNAVAAAAANAPMHALLAGEKREQPLARLQEDMGIHAFVKGETPPARDALRLSEARRAAQKILLRVLSLEERLLEIKELERDCRELSKGFRAVLGVELDEDDAETFGLVLKTEEFSETDFVAPLNVLLENACLLLPEGCTLLFADSAAGKALREAGLTFAPEPRPSRADLGVTLRTAQAVPLRQAIGLSGPRPKRPWLERRFLFALWSAAR